MTDLMPAVSCTPSLVRARLEALLREDPAMVDVTETMSGVLQVAYDHLKASGFSSHHAEMALHQVTRVVLERLWYIDNADQDQCP